MSQEQEQGTRNNNNLAIVLIIYGFTLPGLVKETEIYIYIFP